MVAKGIDLGLVLAKPSSVDWHFFAFVAKLVISEVMVFVQSWWEIVRNA